MEKDTPDNTEDKPGDPSPFQFTKSQLQGLVDPKSKDNLRAMGGLSGLCAGLKVNPEFGVSDSAPTLTRTPTQSSWVSRKSTASTANEDIVTRQRVYGENTLPAKKPKGILQLMWMALQEKILILLTIAAIISLALGIYEDITVHNKVLDRSTGQLVEEPRVKWVEGFAIIVAIFIVVMVGSVNDWQKEKQFMKLNAKKEDRVVQVIRGGRQKEISVYQLVVGDIMCLEPGEIVAADGVFIEGHRLRCDESGITGESDALRKEKLEDCEKEGHEESPADPFLLSGSKVLEGVGKCVVIAVGQQSIHGRTMMALSVESQDTPLQEKLNGLAETIAKLGFAAALLMFIVLVISYFIQFARKNVDRSTPKVIESLVRIIISAVTVVVVAVPEGLPLAVTLALAFATTRMLKDNNLVRILSACETMGNATTICSDKTGTLTQNKMTVVTGTIGEGSFESPQSMPESIDKSVVQQIHDSVAINSTAFENPETKELLGNKTETALLQWIHASGADFMRLRDVQEVGQVWPFSSARKSMNTVARRKGENWRFHTKGAAEIILGRCTQYVNSSDGSIHPITDDDRKRFLNVIEKYALQSLRNIAVAYTDLDSFDASNDEDLEFDTGLTLFGIVGIQDPLRPGVADAVLQCQRAGVFVRMVTGDNVTTAQAIAMQCHIYSDRGIVMEGPEFRAMTDQQRTHIVPRLQVLARSSPEDKKILVETLRKLGQTVAVTGDGTNDGPALKAADIGFSMGIAGTEVAKEASSIILMDDNFASIVKAIKWGRCVNDSVRKFLQFQLTVNITAVFLTFISAAVDYSHQTSVLSAVQLLWVNLIMDTLAALALATDPPDDELLERMPDSRSAPLISFTMWKMIIVQSLFQVIVCLGVLYGYPSLNPDVEKDSLRKAQLSTWIFNIFVWLQIFNEINCRRLDNRLNIFRGIHRNYYFIVIFFLTAIFQVIIVEFGSVAFQTVPLSAGYWATSIGIGVLSLPVGVIARLIPDELFTRKHTATTRTMSMQTTAAPEALPEPYQHTMQDVREQLRVFSALRGGRLKASQYHSGLAAATVMPSLMASMVGLGLGFGQDAATPVGLRPVSPRSNWDTSETQVEELAAKSRERAMSLGLKNA